MRLLSLRLLLLILWVSSSLFLSAVRVQVWGSETALWREAIHWGPWKPRPWVNLGGTYARSGNLALAAYCQREAIIRAQSQSRLRDERYGGQGVAEANLALILSAQGDVVGANAAAHRAMDLASNQPLVVGTYVWITNGQE